MSEYSMVPGAAQPAQCTGTAERRELGDAAQDRLNSGRAGPRLRRRSALLPHHAAVAALASDLGCHHHRGGRGDAW
jgi:hypothetical protein